MGNRVVLAAAGTGAVSFPAAERVSFPKAGEGTRLGRPTPGGWAGLKALPTDIVPLIGRVPLEGAGAAA